MHLWTSPTLVTTLAVVDVEDATGLCWAARILARAGGGAGSAGRSMSPHPSFSSSSTARVWSCASPHPSVEVGDAIVGSSAWRREWALWDVAIGWGGAPWDTDAAFTSREIPHHNASIWQVTKPYTKEITQLWNCKHIFSPWVTGLKRRQFMEPDVDIPIWQKEVYAVGNPQD
jgi:hypothetical protein